MMEQHKGDAKECKKKGVVKEVLGSGDIFVIKVGTSSLVRPEQQTLNLTNLARICETIKALKKMGHHVVIVTSGAVGVGCQRLGLATKPSQLAKKQALAAVGQVHLMKFYEDFLAALGLTCAQVLLTLDNLANRSQYLNARNTFTELLAYGVIPVVNENDTVAVQELRFGDNDTLSAQVAALVQADWLFLLTDVDCLYTANPKDDPNATPIYEVEDISRLTADTSTRGTQWGTGGMATKLTAGRIATAAGCTMVICNSTAPENIVRIVKGEPKLGTKFFPLPHSLKGRKRWILSVPVRGQLWLDAGAVRAVRDKHKSLFAAGITKVTGDFHAQDCVSLCDSSGVELGRGLVNFSTEEVAAVHGHGHAHGQGHKEGGGHHHATHPVAEQLGFPTMEEVVHRENLVLLSSEMDSDEDLTGASASASATPSGANSVANGSSAALDVQAANAAAAEAAGQKLSSLSVASS
ncbi:hypothetical protein CHLRE_17g705850v5 [Chlamydomonas reinhardtii]|uniref:PUA domain-containing protein n=1 Tax=Chlamydomonas reinhardtii TaxID=3055 RepID=A0A2K3CPA9_CHLRE|nr:uncharacterized protein CHLRE_17g705850v5 [Chlamydomonas reinhardtii]PNW70105.1 hypothetical protein CHLRE_17g705850v5 [Chlamydomonas reinhardtii]